MATAFGSLSVLSENISDPSYQLSRLSIIDKDNFLISDSDQLKLVNVHSTTPLVMDDYLDSGNVSRCHSFTLNTISSIKATPSTSSTGSMFQSVRIIDKPQQQATPLAAAVTAQGDLVLCPLHEKEESTCNLFSFGAPSYGTAAPAAGVGYGYVSLCHTPDRLVTGHYLSKTLVWTDLSTLTKTRQSTLFYHPSCVSSSLLPMDQTSPTTSTPVVIVAEGGNIAVFDERQHSKGGCLFRENENNNGGKIWDILPLADSNRVAAAGSDKNIRIYDQRMWKPITKWRAPHKFDVVKLLPSSNNPLQLYVAGRDNEVLLCDLEPHLLSTQVQKIKSRKQPPPSSSSLDKNDVHPQKKQKQIPVHITDSTLSASTAASDNNAPVRASSVQSGDLLVPMQLPTSSKLRISHHRGIRAESNWAGLDVLHMDSGKDNTATDRLVGLCGRGKVYIADSAHLMKLAI